MKRSAALSMPSRAQAAEGDVGLHAALAEEVPVAMAFDGSSLAVMMASPSDIHDFAVGFALTEGIVDHPGQILSFEEVAHERGIEARIWLREDRREALAARRRFMAGPVGCGLCGIDSLDQAVRDLPVVASAGALLSRGEVATAPEALRDRQPLYRQTRATHAAGFLRPGKGIVEVREDVGRHNALDKLIGGLARQGIDPGEGAFVMTSRLSVELVQKCAMAGCPVLIAVSAPTAHAVRLAERAGITLAAFARNGGFEVFSRPERIVPEAPDVA